MKVRKKNGETLEVNRKKWRKRKYCKMNDRQTNRESVSVCRRRRRKQTKRVVFRRVKKEGEES